MSSIRQAKRRLTHDRLLETARSLFESQGYAATTIDDIAGAAGTTRATLYLHFSSKAELLQHLVNRVDEFFSSVGEPTLGTAVRSGDPALVRAWLDGRFDQWTEIRSYLAMVKQSDADPEISSTVDRWHDEVIDRMRSELDAAGRFEPETREIRCTIAFGALETLSRRYLRTGDWDDIDRGAALDALTITWVDLLTEPEPRSEQQR